MKKRPRLCLNPFSIRENCRLIHIVGKHCECRSQSLQYQGKLQTERGTRAPSNNQSLNPFSIRENCRHQGMIFNKKKGVSQSLQYQGKLQTHRPARPARVEQVSIPSVSGKTADRVRSHVSNLSFCLNPFSIRENCRPLMLHQNDRL